MLMTSFWKDSKTIAVLTEVRDSSCLHHSVDTFFELFAENKCDQVSKRQTKDRRLFIETCIKIGCSTI